MKSLKKFYCESAKIELLMLDAKDILNMNVTTSMKRLYIVKETPRNKKQMWHEITLTYDYSDDAHNKFLELIRFWCI